MANLPALQRATTNSEPRSSNDNVYMMQPRINLRRDLVPAENPVPRAVWNVFRRKESCHEGSDYNTCEKGVNTNVTNIAIILGVVYVETIYFTLPQDSLLIL